MTIKPEAVILDNNPLSINCYLKEQEDKKATETQPEKLFNEVSQDYIGYVQQEIGKAVRTERERIIKIIKKYMDLFNLKDCALLKEVKELSKDGKK